MVGFVSMGVVRVGMVFTATTCRMRVTMRLCSGLRYASEVFGEGDGICPLPSDSAFLQGFQDGLHALWCDGIRSRYVNVRGCAGLLALEGIVPEPALPAFAVDERELDWRTEVFQRGIEGEGFDKLRGIGRAIGLHDHHPAPLVPEFPQGFEQFVSRSTTHAIAAERLHLGGEVAELLRIDTGVLIIIDDQFRRQSLHLKRWHEIFEKGGLPRSEKSDNKNKWCHLKKRDAAAMQPVGDSLLEEAIKEPPEPAPRYRRRFLDRF